MTSRMVQYSPVDPRNASMHIPFGAATIVTIASVPLAIRPGLIGLVGLAGVLVACAIIGLTLQRAHRELAATDYWCTECRMRPATADALCMRCADDTNRDH